MTLLYDGTGQRVNWLVQLAYLQRFQVALSFSHILILTGIHLRQETKNKQTNQEKTGELLCGIPGFWPGLNQSHFDLNTSAISPTSGKKYHASFNQEKQIHSQSQAALHYQCPCPGLKTLCL